VEWTGDLFTNAEDTKRRAVSGKRLISKGSKERRCVKICLSGGREEGASASLGNHNTSVHPSCVSVSLQPKAPSMNIVCWTRSASASRVILRGTWPTNCFEVLPWPSHKYPTRAHQLSNQLRSGRLTSSWRRLYRATDSTRATRDPCSRATKMSPARRTLCDPRRQCRLSGYHATKMNPVRRSHNTGFRKTQLWRPVAKQGRRCNWLLLLLRERVCRWSE
jgi:hypothetical protein